MAIHDETRLADRTVGEFKDLRSEVADRLQESLARNGALLSVEDVKRELKLDG